MNGIFNINKPSGITSTEVVRKIKKLTGIKKVGHAGTLDPLASGVLPICVGKATRIIEYLIDQDRSYRGIINLGIETDTFDKEGSIVSENNGYKIPSKVEIINALALFIGDIQQTPPMYSALKINGERLYDLAEKHPSLNLVPLDDVFAEQGLVKCFDARNYYASRCRLSFQGLELLAEAAQKVLERVEKI